MNIEQKDISPTRKAILAHFTADEVSSEENAVVSEFIQFAKIPGFRPGKANPNIFFFTLLINHRTRGNQTPL